MSPNHTDHISPNKLVNKQTCSITINLYYSPSHHVPNVPKGLALVCMYSTWSTIPSRAESRVGWRSRSKCMILLQRHREAGALMGADSPELPVAPDEARLSPLGCFCTPAAATFRDLSSSWEGVVSVGVESEGAWSAGAAVVEVFVCISALTARQAGGKKSWCCIIVPTHISTHLPVLNTVFAVLNTVFCPKTVLS